MAKNNDGSLGMYSRISRKAVFISGEVLTILITAILILFLLAGIKFIANYLGLW